MGPMRTETEVLRLLELRKQELVALRELQDRTEPSIWKECGYGATMLCCQSEVGTLRWVIGEEGGLAFLGDHIVKQAGLDLSALRQEVLQGMLAQRT